MEGAAKVGANAAPDSVFQLVLTALKLGEGVNSDMAGREKIFIVRCPN
jgi:hypothetical protein